MSSVHNNKFVRHCFQVKYIVIGLIYLIVTVRGIIQLCFSLSINVDKSERPSNSTANNSVTTTITFDGIPLNNVYIYYLRIVVTAFNVGYATANCMGGVIADLYGGRYCILFGMTVTSAMALLIPFIIAHVPWYILALIYSLQGYFEGIMVPAQNALYARWIPPNEVTVIVGCISSCRVLSQITVKYMMYYLQHMTTHFWRWMFFFWGGVGLAVAFMAFIFLFSNPYQCKMSSEQEKKDMEAVGGKNPKRINWKMIFEDEAVWASVIEHITSSWQNYVLLAEMTIILKSSHENVGPFPVQASITLWAIVLVAVGSSVTVNRLVKKQKIPVIYMRAIVNAASTLLTGVLLEFIYNTTYGQNISIVLRPLALSFKSLHSPGGQVNILDLTRYYAGTLTGIQNGLGAMLAYIILIIRQGVLESPMLSDWGKMYDLSFSACLIATLLFMIWARAERAPWDVVVEDDDDEFIEEIME